MSAGSRSAIEVIRGSLRNLSERELGVACRVANVPREAIIAFICQAICFLPQFQRVKLQTVSFAGSCRNAVATFDQQPPQSTPLWSRPAPTPAVSFAQISLKKSENEQSRKFRSRRPNISREG
jgi:hypothetical protein